MKGLTPFFVIGSARSGTTSLCRILDTASNGVCKLEPMPNLCRESRDMREGKLKNSLEVLKKSVLPRLSIREYRDVIYGEKNIALAMFIPELYSLTNCKLVYVYRDGRDVVSSMINWHLYKFGDIYRECVDNEQNISQEAIHNAANLPIQLSDSDYARPRPLPGGCSRR